MGPGPNPAPNPALFSSVTFKTFTKKQIFPRFFYLLLFEGTFTSFFKDKRS
jgi:hypothetical protein